MMEEFARHYQIRFREPELLRLALTHRSYLSVSGKGPRESNERLEFLGDSVLGLVTSEFLYRTRPREHEGQLTKTKSLLVSKAILSRRALAMGLGRFVFMSHSEVESGGRQRLSILADAFESVIGAIYLDQGFEPARKFIHDWLLSEAREIAADKRHTNYKSHLQEYVQSTFRTHPVYRIRSEIGPDHSKQFMVDVVVGGRVMGSGKGRNKKEAEQSAARDALEKSHYKVEEPVVEEPPAKAAPSAGRAIEPELERERTGARRRRGRRGGRGEDDAATEPERESSGEAARGTPPPAPRRPASRAPAAPGSGRGGSRQAETGSRPPRPPDDAPADETREWERTRRRHEEEEFEEIGRPEGPLEERHVDPFALEESSDREGRSVEEGASSTDRGRSVVGPMHAGRPSGYDPPDESPGDSEDDDATSGELPAPEGDRPRSTPPPYGRRPGRPRRSR